MAAAESKSCLIYGSIGAIMVVGPVNFLLFRVLYDMYGAKYAFFVSQGINLLYCVIGGFALYPKMWSVSMYGFKPNYSEITQEMRMLPQSRFIMMALLDCGGTFLAAMGAVFTSGQNQTILNQSLVPFTMVASSLLLRTSYSKFQLTGAFTILLGAFIAIWPTLFTHSGANDEDRNPKWMANLLYLSSNIPMALSAVYKESRFQSDDIHPLYLTQWVSIYQFLFGFVLAPLQMIPGISTPQGISFSDMYEAFIGGWSCFLEESGSCPPGSYGTFWLLPGYCTVNFVFNTIGLFLTKYGGATINSISYSMLLPLSTLSNALPMLGQFRENITFATVLGLIVVFVGFAIYERENLFGSFEDESYDAMPMDDESVSSGEREHAAIKEHTASYQERLILLNLPIKPPSSPTKPSSRSSSRSSSLKRGSPHNIDYKSISMTPLPTSDV